MYDNILDLDITYRFGENILSDPGHVDVFPAALIPNHMDRLCKPIHRSSTGMSACSYNLRDNTKERGYRVPTDSTTLSSILQWTADEEVNLQYRLP